MPRFFVLLAMLVFASCGSIAVKRQHKIVALQPIGFVTSREIETVCATLDSAYGMHVVVLPALEAPAFAFTTVKTPRYRADKLLDWLQQKVPDSADYIIGLTELDISTTKTDKHGNVMQPEQRYQDFGIFGLGYCPGKSCIVSTFRLGSKHDLMLRRLAKIAVHEIGHNMGLQHCENRDCVMADAVERVATIDAEELALCDVCKSKLIH